MNKGRLLGFVCSYIQLCVEYVAQPIPFPAVTSKAKNIPGILVSVQTICA